MVRQMLLLLLSRCLRGRIWFHNEIFFPICWCVCSGLLTSKAHRYYFVVVTCMNVQRSAIVFYLKKSNFYFLNM